MLRSAFRSSKSVPHGVSLVLLTHSSHPTASPQEREWHRDVTSQQLSSRVISQQSEEKLEFPQIQKQNVNMLISGPFFSPKCQPNQT